MDIRPLTIDDWVPMGRLISEAFCRGEPCPDEISDAQRETFPNAKRLGAFEDGNLEAALTILDIDVHWNGEIQRMGGIAGVCCASSARGRGYVGALMRESLVQMRDWGQPISGLYPFSQAFYRRFGWESATERRTYTLPTRIIPTSPDGLNVSTYLGPDATDIVKPIYDRYASRYQGMAARAGHVPESMDWPRGLANSGGLLTYVQVYTNPVCGEPEGYFTFRFLAVDQPAALGEFVTLTASAYRGLLATLHNYGSQVEHFTWHGPADHPLPLFINEKELQTTLRPVMMGRIVDVEGALALTHATCNGRVTVRIHDEHAPWNDGAFAIVANGGQVAVSRSTDMPHCSMDIQTLSIACWGAHSLPALRGAGRISVSDEAAFSFLADLLPQRVPYIADTF